MRIETNEIERLRRSLPMSAYPRRQLLGFLLTQGVVKGATPKLAVVDIFPGGDDFGAMCRFVICGENQSKSFVAPFSQIATSSRFSSVGCNVSGPRTRAIHGPI